MALGRHLSSRDVTRIARDLYVRQDPASRRYGAAILPRGIAMNEFARIETDFLQKAGSTVPLPWTSTKTGTDNTADFVANTADGVYKFTCGATSEAQAGRIDWADQLLVNMSKAPRIEARIKPQPAGANYGTTSRLVVGFSSAFNSTLDNVTTNAWFRLGDAADLKIRVEGDDNTTDTDDQDSGLVWVAGAYTTLEVDIGTDLIARFMVDGTAAGQVSLAALGANTLVQPMIAFQRASGTVLDAVSIDYAQVTWTRS